MLPPPAFNPVGKVIQIIHSKQLEIIQISLYQIAKLRTCKGMFTIVCWFGKCEESESTSAKPAAVFK